MPKISQLPIQTNAGINSGDSLAIVDSFTGETKQIPMGQMDVRYTGVPDGGTSQQVLAKNTGTNKDVYWKTLDKNSVGLGQVDNVSDANKPISNATQSALNLKANTSALAAKADVTALTTGLATKQDKLPTGTDGDVLTLVAGIPAWTTGGGGGGAVSSVFGRIGAVVPQTGDYDKSMVGLDQVDNTSDLDKPISNLTQTALNAKQASLGNGTTNQVLKWIGGVPTWAATNPLTTKGDLLGFSTTDVRVPVGTDGKLLTADSTAASGVAWKDAPVSLPVQTGQNGKWLQTDGTSASWQTLPPSLETVFGDWAAPIAIAAATGFRVASTNMNLTNSNVIYVKGPSAGETLVTANPVFEAPTTLNLIDQLIGCSDTDGLLLQSGNGLLLVGPWQSGLGNTLTLRRVSATLRLEIGRTTV